VDFAGIGTSKGFSSFRSTLRRSDRKSWAEKVIGAQFSGEDRCALLHREWDEIDMQMRLLWFVACKSIDRSRERERERERKRERE